MSVFTNQQLESLQAYDFLWDRVKRISDHQIQRCSSCFNEVEDYDSDYCKSCIKSIGGDK